MVMRNGRWALAAAIAVVASFGLGCRQDTPVARAGAWHDFDRRPVNRSHEQAVRQLITAANQASQQLDDDRSRGVSKWVVSRQWAWVSDQERIDAELNGRDGWRALVARWQSEPARFWSMGPNKPSDGEVRSLDAIGLARDVRLWSMVDDDARARQTLDKLLAIRPAMGDQPRELESVLCHQLDGIAVVQGLAQMFPRLESIRPLDRRERIRVALAYTAAEVNPLIGRNMLASAAVAAREIKDEKIRTSLLADIAQACIDLGDPAAAARVSPEAYARLVESKREREAERKQEAERFAQGKVSETLRPMLAGRLASEALVQKLLSLPDGQRDAVALAAVQSEKDPLIRGELAIDAAHTLTWGEMDRWPTPPGSLALSTNPPVNGP